MVQRHENTRSGNPHPAHRSEHALPYAAGLDGLRAFAVLAVILYHGGATWLRGGFLGVEIFFVISGYLITSLLLGERERSGRINLKAFWLRRARRLLPAVFALLLVTLAYAVLFLPDQVASLRKDVVAAAFYVSNWYLIVDQKSYFEAVGRPSLLLHLWSLAVEEQFYLFWPIFLSVALRWFRRPAVLGLTLGIAAASAVLMALLFVPDVDPSRIYYGTDTRASGLLTGAALAFLWRPWLNARPVGRKAALGLDALGIAALVALGGFCLGLGEYDPFLYRGGFVLLSLATALAIGVAVHPGARIGRAFLGRQPLRWIGLRSYSIYLWHWPIFTVTRPQLDVPIDGLPLLAVRLALTALLAELSYRLVETPIRGGALGRAWQSLAGTSGARRRRLILRYGGALTALAIAVLSLGVAAARAVPPTVPDYLAIGAIRTVGSSEIEPAVATPPAATTTSDGALATGAGAPAELASSAGLATPIPAPTEESSTPAAVMPTATAVGAPTPAASPTAKPLVGRAGVATLIGDSVVLSAWAAVHEVPNLEVDGEVNRQASEAIKVLREEDAAGWLGSTVIVHIGNNGPFSERQFEEMMRVLGSERRVIFMTVRVPRQWEAANNEVIVGGAKNHPNVEILDWRAAASSHPEWLRDDGIHTNGPGALAYAQMIGEAIGQ